MTRQQLDVNLVVVSATIAATVGTAFFVTLLIVARPSHYSARLAEITRQIHVAEAQLQSSGDPRAYSPKAVCRGDAGAASAVFKQQLQSAAAATSVTLVNAQAVAGASDEANGGLTPIAVQLDGNGRYDSVVLMLGSLAKLQPQLFVDNVDLKSQTSSVNIKLTGRIYCSTSARL